MGVTEVPESQMETNALPKYDTTDNPTGCCPRFKPEGWDDAELHFQDKLFVCTKTKSVAHIPLNMAAVFRKTFKAIEDADAHSDEDFIVMSRDRSAWSAEHLFSVKREVPGQEMVRLNGDFLTTVFEGPYNEVPRWHEQAVQKVKARGKETDKVFFFYTTCPRCAKTYGKNYVIAVAQVA
jgi:hypothetical protein